MRSRMCVVGAGWRGQWFMKLAKALPEYFELAGVAVRTPETAKEMQEKYGVPVYADYIDMIEAQKPEFVVVAASNKAVPQIAVELNRRGIPALCETAYSNKLEDLEEYYKAAGENSLIQYAEQYHLQPMQQARRNFAQSGLIGDVFEAQVSISQCYHGISVMRKLIDVNFEPVRIGAKTFKSKINMSPDRQGDPKEDKLVDDLQTIGWFDYGDKLGVFDNAKNQLRSWARHQRTQVMGTKGEIMDKSIRYLKDYLTPIETELTRIQIGFEESMEGIGLRAIAAEGKYWYENEFRNMPFIDDEIAVATMMVKMRDFARGGESFYPLEQSLQDQYLSVMMERACAEGQFIDVPRPIWAK